MTVKELIKELKKVKNKDIDVIVRGTDPTDFVYYKDVELTGTEKVYLDFDDSKKTKVFLIDGGLF